jgi:hypothetical protein
VILSEANTSNGFRHQVEQDGFAVVPACLDEATVQLLSKQFDDTRYPERISCPSRVFGRLQYHGLCAKSWRLYLGQSALRCAGFSSIRLDVQIGKWCGTKI